MRWLLLVVLAVFVAGCQHKAAEQPVQMPAPATQTVEGPTEKELPAILDLPLYPGAKLISSKIALAGNEKRYRVLLETPDSAKKVADFYQAHGIQAAVEGDKAQAMGATKKGNLVIVNIARAGAKTQIELHVSPEPSH